MSARTFYTPFIITIGDGRETELTLRIKYDFTPKQADGFDEPGHGDTASIAHFSLIGPGLESEERAIPDWLDVMIHGDELLHESLVEAAVEEDEQAADGAAERSSE